MTIISDKMKSLFEQKMACSYRDPSGYVFTKGGQIFRRINSSYLDTYYRLKASNLFDELIRKQLLIDHKEIEKVGGNDPHIIIKPHMIQFISYPYEWSFSQLKEAALTTLEIQRMAILRGFTLKDAHGFNIQFYQGVPILIDTLSFEYWDRTPWKAYKQFCESFLIPLALMGYISPNLNALLIKFLNGIPLEVGSRILPPRSWLNPSLLLHIHLHAARKLKDQKDHVGLPKETSCKKKFGEDSMLGLCMSLEKAVQSIKPPKLNTVWDAYYQKFCIYSNNSFSQKKNFIIAVLQRKHLKLVLDLGCNTGEFSILAANFSNLVIALDNDHTCVEELYLHCKGKNITNILPLQIDLVNPSPALGWELNERFSLLERIECDLILVLALIHHLCIASNIPLNYLAKFLGRIAKSLIIEFIPKEDQQVKLLLSSREDIFANYDQDQFELEFAKYFRIDIREQLSDSCRFIYYMERF
jgi:SAM-dependent methyltransferase